MNTIAINNLVNLATSNGFAGIDLDFEAVIPADKAAYSGFVAALAVALHNNNLKLIISIPPKSSDTAPDYNMGYDYVALGNAVDYFQVMTYDQVGPGWSSSGFNNEVWPGPESGADWQKTLLAYAASRVAPAKVLAGLPSYGYDYSTGNTVHWSDFAGIIRQHSATLHIDAASATPYATWGTVKNQADGKKWSNNTAQPVLWYDDASSIKAKTGLVGSLGLGGTSVWAMGYENADFWSAVQAGLGSSQATSFIVHASAGTGGAIAPSGDTSVAKGNSLTYSITPASGYNIASLTVDGAQVGTASTYTFNNVTSAHTISAAFAVVSGGGGTGTGGGTDTNIAGSGTGYIWAKNASAYLNTNKVASKGINDGKLTVGVNLNADGEGGKARYEGAGVIFSAARTVSSVSFVNGTTDSNGNGFLGAGLALQFTTDGSTWVDSGWAVKPGYAYSAAASGVTYAFSGTAKSGVIGVRVVGKTSDDSWSWIVNEVQVIGH